MPVADACADKVGFIDTPAGSSVFAATAFKTRQVTDFDLTFTFSAKPALITLACVEGTQIYAFAVV